MKVWPVFGMVVGGVLGLVACSGSTASIGDPGPGDGGTSSDGGTTVDGATMADGGTIIPLYGQCGALPALGGGSYQDPTTGLIVSWPAGWTSNPGNASFFLQKPYTYVPTGAASPSNSTAGVSSYSGTTDKTPEDALKRLDQQAAAYAGAHVERLTIAGLPAVFWWEQAPPPQPGCMGCPGDPGPDIVTLGVMIADGVHTLQIGGGARVNADPASIFCDIQAILLGVTLPKR